MAMTATGTTRAQRTRTRTHACLRAAIAVQTLTIFCQATTAGLLLTAGTSGTGETLHSIGARVMYAASMLYLAAAVVARRPGGGSARPIWYASGFLVMASAQVVLGVTHHPALHVPLGVLMFGLSLLDLGLVLARPGARRA